jgi:tyrosine-protein phosphatase YwqE
MIDPDHQPPQRNAMFAQTPEILYDLIRQGAVGRVTSQSITGGFGRKTQKTAESFLRHGLSADRQRYPQCNDAAPLLADAVEMATRIVGPAMAEAMVEAVPAAILKNDQIPDLGEPVSPAGN